MRLSKWWWWGEVEEEDRERGQRKGEEGKEVRILEMKC